MSGLPRWVKMQQLSTTPNHRVGTAAVATVALDQLIAATKRPWLALEMLAAAKTEQETFLGLVGSIGGSRMVRLGSWICGSCSLGSDNCYTIGRSCFCGHYDFMDQNSQEKIVACFIDCWLLGIYGLHRTRIRRKQKNLQLPPTAGLGSVFTTLFTL